MSQRQKLDRQKKIKWKKKSQNWKSLYFRNFVRNVDDQQHLYTSPWHAETTKFSSIDFTIIRQSGMIDLTCEIDVYLLKEPTFEWNTHCMRICKFQSLKDDHYQQMLQKWLQAEDTNSKRKKSFVPSWQWIN